MDPLIQKIRLIEDRELSEERLQIYCAQKNYIECQMRTMQYHIKDIQETRTQQS